MSNNNIDDICGFLGRDALPEYRWMTIPEVFFVKAADFSRYLYV